MCRIDGYIDEGYYAMKGELLCIDGEKIVESK